MHKQAADLLFHLLDVGSLLLKHLLHGGGGLGKLLGGFIVPHVDAANHGSDLQRATMSALLALKRPNTSGRKLMNLVTSAISRNDVKMMQPRPTGRLKMKKASTNENCRVHNATRSVFVAHCTNAYLKAANVLRIRIVHLRHALLARAGVASPCSRHERSCHGKVAWPLHRGQRDTECSEYAQTDMTCTQWQQLVEASSTGTVDRKLLTIVQRHFHLVRHSRYNCQAVQGCTPKVLSGFGVSAESMTSVFGGVSVSAVTNWTVVSDLLLHHAAVWSHVVVASTALLSDEALFRPHCHC